MINETVKHYEIREKLGEGGMGVVYKAYDSKLDRMVALKFLPRSLSSSEDRNKRFLNEARAASALHHNNTCTIYEIDETADGQMYIVMPVYPGKSLDRLIEQEGLSLEQALDLAIQIGEGLNAAHDQDIIHRDIKSNNIMVTDDGQAIIMDFGLAKRKETTRLTKTGETLGTVPYMSPEQATGDELDQRTDIWSLGVLIYEMLTGETPFNSSYPQAVVYSILHEEPENLISKSPELPASLGPVVHKALEKDRDRRYQQVDQLVEALKKIRRDIRTADQDEKPVRSSKETQWFSSPLHLIALVLATGVLAVAGYFTFSTTADRSAEEVSIAVLPFETIGEQENSTFTRGIHGGLLTRLSNISGLKVTSRTSTLQYREQIKPMPEIARELNVDWIVRGEVQETLDRVQVDARLVYAPEDRQVWAQNYRRNLTANNLFEIQSDLALEITGELQTRLSPEEKTRVERKPTMNLNAYRNFTEGVSLLEQRTPDAVLRSVDYFMDAIDEDPEYAPAWAILGEALIYIDFYKYDTMDNYSISPQEAIDTALELNPDLAESHASLGILYYTQKMGTKAVAELNRAIELQPSYETAQNWLGFLYLLTGQPKKAIVHAKRAIELNPLAPASRLYPSLSYLANNQPEQALKEVQRAREIQPEWGEIYAFEGIMLYHNGRYDEALHALQKADSLIGSEAKSVWIPDMASVARLAARAAGGSLSIDMRSASWKSHPFWSGLEAASAKDVDRAISEFQKIDQYSMWPNISLRYYFPDILGPVREDPRYADIIDAMNRQWQ
ncbi:MAG: protein kinase [Balneolaceae bacterium]|nr:protein kinase [Balneolaceae bacterium]